MIDKIEIVESNTDKQIVIASDINNMLTSKHDLDGTCNIVEISIFSDTFNSLVMCLEDKIMS